MRLLDRALELLTADPRPLETRAIDSFADTPGLTEQLLRVQGLRTSSSWAPVGLRDALAIPAVFRAVTLISNLIGTFTLEAWRNGVRMAEPPRIVQRPDPFRTARDFWRSIGWNLATRGEADLYIGARDSDGLPLSVLSIPPAELQGRYEDPRDELVHRVSWEWRNVPIPSSSIVQIV